MSPLQTYLVQVTYKHDQMRISARFSTPARMQEGFSTSNTLASSSAPAHLHTLFSVFNTMDPRVRFQYLTV